VKLTIVGRFDPDDPYYHELTRLVMRRGLERHVTFAGVVTNRTLHAHYRRADVFVTLSEHEGFCVPVVEAMFFDLPVVALAATALPETLGAAGLLVERTADAAEIAALIHCLRTDSGLSARLLEAQRMRRRDFLPDQIYPHVERLVLDLTG
jgi:glycosyltransferase involved in cell wall biosynthesis